ncbi:SDR family oxidoreductase [Actinocorallia sp. B10E7]|uniref:SDR family NAD(P)-dependent oxidoreductase n=1 Tax=Actinocorallia sp. B10E7 TaxID=3153558 RepID=UPI00325E3DA7
MPTALITGATAGIGAAFARRLAKDGLDLVLVARNAENLAETADRLRGDYGVAVEALQADLADDQGISRVEDRLRQGVDLLVNNAGFGHQGTFLDVPVEEELRMLKVHCEAVLRLTYAALPGMRNRRKGGIVNVASVAAFFSRGTYGASKAWVVSFSQAVAQDVKDPNVKVMALCPGFVHTEFHERAKMDVSGIPEALWLNADDVVDAALKDLKKGVQVSVPGPQYKAIVGLGKFVPRNLAGRLSSKTGRRYD